MNEERLGLQDWGIADKALRRAINKRATELAGTGTWFGIQVRQWLAMAATRQAAARRQAVCECLPELIEFVRTCAPQELLRIGQQRSGQ